MPGRKFELPGIQALSKEQERVRALPLEGQHLIIGGPGTGKSIVALLRAKRLADEGLPYRFLVFNHLLERASRQLYPGVASQTWPSWFVQVFTTVTEQHVPRTERTRGGFAPFDWPAALGIARSAPEIENPPFLVIDEGQDMPPEFYQCLVLLGIENFFVVADQNQQIADEHSSRRQIETELDIEPGEVIELRRNFRNAHHVAKLAHHFYTGDPASPPPEIPAVPEWQSQAATPILFRFAPRNLQKVARRILRLWEGAPRKLIGVIAPNNQVRQEYFEEIGKELAGGTVLQSKPRVQTFASDDRPNVRFDEGGILVINVQACKGLEFDVVVGADIDAHFCNPADLDGLRKTLYVMVARARERIILLGRRGPGSAVDRTLPHDHTILKREGTG